MGFVKGGKGVCGIHAATDNFPSWPEAAAMMGGMFHGHPWGGGGTWAVQTEEPGHPLNKGFDGKGFWVNGEIYKMKDPFHNFLNEENTHADENDDRFGAGHAPGNRWYGG